jgi:hypothetical protein
VVLEARSIECDLFHPLCLGFLRNALANGCGGFDIAAIANFFAYVGLERGRGCA